MPLTILVVDDDLGTRLSVSDYLELSGYLAVTAADGQKALAMVDQCQPHLIITDVTMPKVDGYEFVRQVRTKPMFRLLPVIFLTAHNTTEDRIKGYRLGCDAYLPKPFELKELGAVVRNLLERSQMIQSEWRQQVQWAEQTPTPERPEKPHSVEPSSVGEEMDLTGREQEVLMLLLDGLSNAQIGDRLYLSPRTVEKYVSNLLRKTETNNRAELVRFAMEHHLAD